MTDQEWQSGADSARMLAFLTRSGQVTDRKLRLFAVGCCRRLAHLLEDERSRRAVTVSEGYADGLASAEELQSARSAAQAAVEEWREAHPGRTLAQTAVLRAQEAAAWTATDHPARPTQQAAVRAAGLAEAAAVAGKAGARLREAWQRCLAVVPAEMVPTAWQAMALPTWRAVATERARTQDARHAGQTAEKKKQSDLLRDLIGPPLRAVQVDAAWLRWNDGCLMHLTQAVYESRRFQDLPIVADALEEAGCTNEDLLRHCRQPGEHGRGCWALDAILGKT